MESLYKLIFWGYRKMTGKNQNFEIPGVHDWIHVFWTKYLEKSDNNDGGKGWHDE